MRRQAAKADQHLDHRGMPTVHPPRPGAASSALILLLLCVGPAAAVSVRERLSLHRPKALELLSTKDGGDMAPGLGPDQSGCSCYAVKNPFCCWQGLCVCHNVCYNGSALLGNFRRQPCVAPRPPLPTSPGTATRKASPLKPVPCRKTDKFRRILAIVLKEAPMPGGLGFRPPKWRSSRKAIEWREGTTYLQPLDETCINISHFLGKTGQVMLINNASSVPGLPYYVDRFMFPREHHVVARMAEAGRNGWQANVLRHLIALASKRRYGPNPLKDEPGFKVRRFFGVKPLMNGLVEFESAFDHATERHPMCFDHVVLPGILKAVTYPGGPEEGELMRHVIREDLGLGPPTGVVGDTPRARARPPVELLYIARTGAVLKQRRVLTPDSEDALLKLLRSLSFRVTRVDFTGMGFRDQFEAVQNADILLGLHGAALTNAVFARNRSVAVEIMPFKVFHKGYYFSTVNAGVTYMLHQCRQGTPQPRDDEFEGLSVRGCMDDPECKEYFTHRRSVELTREDLLDMSSLLMQARQVVVEARWNLKWALRKLRQRYDTLCVAKRRDVRCRLDLIRSHYADPDYECILNRDCEGRVLPDSDNVDEVL